MQNSSHHESDDDRSREIDRPEVTRIIDANANRASEGLRVVEDFLRFAQEDAFLSRVCKQIRHDLAMTLSRLHVDRWQCRSTLTDVGTATSTDSEYQRPSLISIVTANLKRSTEALRTLEEYAKLSCAETARQFESLRYRVYTLEKSVGHAERAKQKLAKSNVYVLVDLQGTFESFSNRIEMLVAEGVDVIQLREKQASERSVIEAGRLLRKLTNGTDTLYVMNDRPDIAKITHADGVHLGQDEMSVADARSIVETGTLIGVSTHSVRQAQQAVLDGADYIGVGPVFESKTKQFAEFVGLDLVKQVTAEVGIPVFAIGGITVEAIGNLLSVGANRVAVSNAIWNADKPQLALQLFQAKLADSNESDEQNLDVSR